MASQSTAPGMNAAILKGVGAPVTPRTVRDVSAWHQAEGGGATFNPFNTTQPYRGAGNYNSVGVKNYPSLGAGVQATVQTLKNGHYGNILDVLRHGGSPSAFASAVGSSPWGTSGSTLARVLNSAYTPTKADAAAVTSAPSAGAAIPDHRAALVSYLLKNSMSLLNGGTGLGGAELTNLFSQKPTTAQPNAQAAALQPTARAATGNVAPVRGELALPADYKATHNTSGPPGFPAFPAVDNFAAPGTPALAPVSGKIVDVHMIPWNRQQRVGGMTLYLQGDNGKTYFLTHLSGKVPTGAIKAGQPIGTVAKVPGGWWPSHIHEGSTTGIYNPGG